MASAASDHAALCTAAANALAAVPAGFKPEVMIGFDGFVDNIIDVVATRRSPSEYDRIPTIAEYGKRVSAAAGKSANFETVVKLSKLGGNGPIMANAMAAQDSQATVVGLFGEGAIDPVFQQLAGRAKQLVSMGPPAITDALEFDDGKLMMGKHASLANCTFDRLVAACGGIEKLRQAMRQMQGIAAVNWTMCLGVTEIWRRLAREVLPGLRNDRPLLFADLTDPAKRTKDDLLAGLAALQELQQHGDVILSTNEMECRQVAGALGLSWTKAATEWDSARETCVAVRGKLGLSRVACHLVRSSAVAWDGGSAGAEGFFEPHPKITTGAGDHYNAGFFGAMLAGIAPAHCLLVGAATSGHYVRTAQSPTRAQVIDFLRQSAAR